MHQATLRTAQSDAGSVAMTEGDEEFDMFKEFVVSKEDLQSPRSSPVDCCDAGADWDFETVSGSQWSPAVTAACNGLTAGMDLTRLVDEPGQVNISAPPLSPSVDGSDSHSPTSCSSFTFAGKAYGVKHSLAKHAQHAQMDRTMLVVLHAVAPAARIVLLDAVLEAHKFLCLRV